MTAILDNEFQNRSIVEIIEVKKLFTTVKDEEGRIWDIMNDRLTSLEKEFIICSAIWYKEIPMIKEIEGVNPININKGLVVCGRRHANCIFIVSCLTGLRSVQFALDGVGESIQGFITSMNRFVDRQEAYEIAYRKNQIISINKNRPTNEIGLTSEDLY